METTRVPPSPCEACGARLDAAAAPSGAPSPGDFSICYECGHVACYDRDLRLVDVPLDRVPPGLAALATQLRLAARPCHTCGHARNLHPLGGACVTRDCRCDRFRGES